MKLTNLETFVWVASLGSFRAAAERLHATQPTISARIAALERSLGVTLFDRSGKSASLSPLGLQLLPYAEKMLGLASEIDLLIGDKEALRGIVRLGTSETLVHTWLPDLLRRVHEEYPGVTVEILVDLTVNLRERLVSRETDVAFLLGPVAEPNMANTALCAYEMVSVC
jgi:DNA-binding transcriptional LysR family regulator